MVNPSLVSLHSVPFFGSISSVQCDDLWWFRLFYTEFMWGRSLDCFRYVYSFELGRLWASILKVPEENSGLFWGGCNWCWIRWYLATRVCRAGEELDRSLSQTIDCYVYRLQWYHAVKFCRRVPMFGRNLLPSFLDQTDWRTEQKSVILTFTAVKASHPKSDYGFLMFSKPFIFRK